MEKDSCLTGITTYEGNLSEAVVLTAYIREGFLVSLPFNNGAAYDFIVDTGARLVKVQVKTGKIESGCVIYNARRHRGSKYNTFSRYRTDEVDLFAVWCPDTQQLYAVPSEHLLTVAGRLRVIETLNSQEKKVRWARDYSWERHIDRLRSERLSPPEAEHLI